MRIDVFSIFPQMITDYTAQSIISRAVAKGRIEVRVHDIREYSTDAYRSVDDTPYGGGAGMLMACNPVFSCVEAVNPPRPLFLMSPSGRTFDQDYAKELSCREEGFSLLAGRYEGLDARIEEHLVDGVISVGDFVLAGGELAALVVLEAVARIVPEVLGNADSVVEESFSNGLLEYPQYTRPANYRGWQVPEVLLSGHHGEMERWRAAQSLARTIKARPDLIQKRGGIKPDEAELLSHYGYSYLVEA